MTKQELQQYKQKLLDKLQMMTQSVQNMGEMVQCARRDATGDLTNIPTHIADISADTFAQDLTLGLIENKEAVIRQIRQALDRIDNGTYGKCDECGEKIGKTRLDYIPYSTLCIGCKMEEERRKQSSRSYDRYGYY